MTALRRAAVLTGIIVFVVTSLGLAARATYGARTAADEPQYLLTALSIVEDRDLDIADELRTERWRAFHESDLPEQTARHPDGQRLSPHNPGLPVFLAPLVGLGGWVAAKLGLAALAGLLAALLAWIAGRRFAVAPRTAALVVGVFGCSAPLAVYGTQVYPEVVAALAVTVSLCGVLPVVAGTPRRAAVMLAVAGMVALPWLSVKYVPVAAVLAVALVVGLRGQRRWQLVTSASLVAAGIAYLLFHRAVYGGWTPYAAGDHFAGGELEVVGVDPDYFDRGQRLLGLFVDRGFGLVSWQPAFLLSFVALGWVLRRRPAGWWVLMAVAGVGWLMATFFALTMHGWWFPGRQVVVVLPALVLLIALWAAQSRRRLWTTVGLGLLGVAGWLLLAWEATSGRITLVVDFGATVNPMHRLLRSVLPDYQTVSAMTWVLHTAWIVVVAGLVGWGWHSGRAAVEGSDGRNERTDPALTAVGAAGRSRSR